MELIDEDSGACKWNHSEHGRRPAHLVGEKVKKKKKMKAPAQQQGGRNPATPKGRQTTLEQTKRDVHQPRGSSPPLKDQTAAKQAP